MGDEQPPSLEKLHIYLTDECNNRCDHCWVLAGPDRRCRLTSGAVQRQIDKIIPLGLRAVKITGGEPLVHRSVLQDILRHAASQGLATSLETNASLLGLEDAQVFRDLGVQVFTSLDGQDADSHDRLRGRRGSFEETLAGIKKLRSLNVNVAVISCLFRENANQVQGIASLAVDLGVSFLKFNFVTPYGRAQQMQRDARLLTTKEILDTARHIETTLSGKIDLDVDIPRVFRLHPNAAVRCPVLNFVSILPDGTYSLCGIGVTRRELVLGNVQNDDLDTIWCRHPLLQEMRDKVRHRPGGICRRCTEYQRCLGHCLAYCFQRFGELRGPHPLCQDTFALGVFPAQFLRANDEAGSK